MAEHDGRHLGQPKLPGRRHTAMAGDDAVLFVDQHRIGKAELADRRRDLRDLLLAMGAGVARVGNEITGLAIGDLQPGAFRQGLGQRPGLDVRHNRAFRICAAGSP